MHSRVQLILLPQKIKGKALKIKLPLVILDLIKVMLLTLRTNNREISPSRTSLFARMSLVLVVVFMVITHMSVLFFHRCGSYGSLK